MSLNIKIIALLIAIASSILIYFSVFVVNPTQQAIVFKFREVKRTDYEAGFHFMIPFVNEVRKYEKRLLNLDQDPERFLTKEKKDLIVDYYAKWYISDLKKFYTATRGDIAYATNTIISQRINSALRDEFGLRTVQEVVSGERNEILEIVRKETQNLHDEIGVVVVDVRTKRIDLPKDVSNSVYNRMRSERKRVAKDFRARGSEAAERIRADADRKREITLANAYRDAEITRGNGDAKATQIYAEAYQVDEEFYSLYRSLDAYKNSFNDNDILLLEPDSYFFKYFNQSQLSDKAQ